jgi:UDP:flavonoid glycosyltransferase YjiC (YdhE family)
MRSSCRRTIWATATRWIRPRSAEIFTHRAAEVLGIPRITYRPVDPHRFVADLAACRAILSTAGNQLVGEAMHLGKALLAAPEDSAEQHVNAVALQRLGMGEWAPRDELDGARIASFLRRAEAYGVRARSLARDGTDAAVEAIERFAAELRGDGAERRRAA